MVGVLGKWNSGSGVHQEHCVTKHGTEGGGDPLAADAEHRIIGRRHANPKVPKGTECGKRGRGPVGLNGVLAPRQDYDRARGRFQHAVGGAADQEVVEGGVAMRPHHDEVCLLLIGGLENVGDRGAGDE